MRVICVFQSIRVRVRTVFVRVRVRVILGFEVYQGQGEGYIPCC